MISQKSSSSCCSAKTRREGSAQHKHPQPVEQRSGAVELFRERELFAGAEAELVDACRQLREDHERGLGGQYSHERTDFSRRAGLDFKQLLVDVGEELVGRGRRVLLERDRGGLRAKLRREILRRLFDPSRGAGRQDQAAGVPPPTRNV